MIVRNLQNDWFRELDKWKMQVCKVRCKNQADGMIGSSVRSRINRGGQTLKTMQDQ
jgi:hypothetical protein